MVATNDVLAEADRNMLETWEWLTDLGPAPGRTEVDGLVMLSTGVPVSLFNPTHVVGTIHDPGAAVAAVTAHYGELGAPFSIVFRDDVAPGLADACASAGLVEHWQMPLMVLDPIPADGGGPVPDGLEIITVDESTIEAYGDVLAEGFGMPRELVSLILGPTLLGHDAFTALLGLLDGQPAATSGVYVSGDIAGVYNVATVPSARGKGVGAAITWAAALAGREAGMTRSILQASQMGEPVYARMGYERPARYRQFEPAPTI
ncbi:MAG TPA: GNAT family N-acetyltransferase [Acidimicrobiales bacterium]|nr:GNAT family N-acetyltransferase [Acidimicrobiales bacterium]